MCKLNKKGFMLIEILSAGVILTIIVIGMFHITGQMSISTLHDRNRIKSDNFAQQLLEESKAVSGTSFEGLEILSSDSITRTEFPGFAASRSIGGINSVGEREIRVKISWTEGTKQKQSNYYLKLVKGSSPAVGGTVTGYVKDKIGNGISEADVYAPNVAIGEPDIKTTTDANGFFVLTRVCTGTQPITAQKLGSSPTSTNFVQGYYNSSDYSWEKSVDVLVKETEIITCSDITLDPLGYITGKITDAYDGTTIIDNIGVRVYFTWGSQTKWWNVYTDTSNPIPPFSDTYIIYNVIPPKNYYFGKVYRKNGSLCTIQETNPAFEQGYCELDSTKIKLSDFVGYPPHTTFSPSVERLGWLKAKVTDNFTNLPIANAIVEADSHIDSGLYGYSVVTDFNGNYAYYNMYDHNRAQYSSNPPVYASKKNYLKTDKSIAVNKNQLNVCNIKLYPSDCVATVIGTVQIKEGAESPRLANENEVEIYAERFDSTYTSRIYTYARTRADGTYELNNVRPNFDSMEERVVYFRLPGGIKGNVQGFIYEDTVGKGLGGANVSCTTSLGNYTDMSDSIGPIGFYELKDVRQVISMSKTKYLPPDPPPPDKVIVDCTLDMSRAQIRISASKLEYNNSSSYIYLMNNGIANLNLILTKKDICFISGAVTDIKTANGIANITVRSGGKSTITNNNGEYSISEVPINLDNTVIVSTDSTFDYEIGSTSRANVNPGDILTNVDIAIEPKYSGM